MLLLAPFRGSPGIAQGAPTAAKDGDFSTELQGPDARRDLVTEPAVLIPAVDNDPGCLHDFHRSLRLESLHVLGRIEIPKDRSCDPGFLPVSS